jgi:hypothetical protein
MRVEEDVRIDKGRLRVSGHEARPGSREFDP